MVHETVRITISSPLGLLWQNHKESKADGNVTNRDFPNISETVEDGETPIEAAVRALSEECGLTIARERFRFVSERSETKPSPTTGQMKTYQFWDFDLELSHSEAEGLPLIVDEGDCWIYLGWRKSAPKGDAPANGGRNQFSQKLGGTRKNW